LGHPKTKRRKQTPERRRSRKAASGKAQAATKAGPAQAIFLVGFMGAGKSSVGRALAEQLGWEFEDLDQRIEHSEERMVAEIFRDSGEREFRRVESAALEQAIEELRAGSAKIIALGGGAFVQKDNAARLKASGIPTVFLSAPVEELWERCRKQAEESGNARPLLGSKERFQELHESRRRNYLKASLLVETGGRSVHTIATEIAEICGLTRFAVLEAKTIKRFRKS
jgi:shikimate kinase